MKNINRKLVKRASKIAILLTILLIVILENLMLLKTLTIIMMIIALIFHDKSIKNKEENKSYEGNKNRNSGNEKRHTEALEILNSGIWQWDEQLKNIYVSNKILKLLGTKGNTIPLEQWYEYVYYEDRERVKVYFDNICRNRFILDVRLNYRLVTMDNRIVLVEFRGKGKVVDGIYYLVGLLIDITNNIEDKWMGDYKSEVINNDAVTGVPNRRYLINQLQTALERNKKLGTKSAVLFIDLDNFKYINDTYGHDMGDSLLIRLCKIVKSIIGKECLFGRFGGDEFIIAIQNITELSEARDILNNLLNTLKRPINIDGKEIHCAISIGVSIYPDDANRLDMLLKTADMAMYKAKAKGKGRYEFFDINILSSIKRQYKIEKALTNAIQEDEIYLVYQPKISLKNGKIHGFEALVRWKNKELGFVSPGEFIPIAETSGLITDLGKYIIEESFIKCKELSLQSTEKFHFAINISDVQLRDEKFVDFVKDRLDFYQLDSSYIEFEITENIIMKSVSRNIEILLELKELGLSIALDDFGTGYSSLNYLRRLPIDVLKIDKSFIDGIGVDEKSEYIAESIIKLSHNLELKVIAEGVETAEQLEYLNKMNCDVVQGYYFSKPEKFEVIQKMIFKNIF